MVPAFGFSVGDFIAAIVPGAGLIAKVSKAVKDKSGASNDYQHVLLELQALERTLRHLQALQPGQGNVDHVNAIRGMALTCRIPLQDFLNKIHRYETSLGPFAMHSRGCLRAAGRKSQWAVFMSDEVAKLRTAVGAKVLSINLLLATHTSESLSRMEAEAHKSHLAVLGSILEQRMSIERLDKKMNKAQASTRDDLQRQSEKMEKVAGHMESAAETLRHVSNTTDAVNTTVMSFRTLAVQLLQTIHHFPAQIRETLEQVVRTNIQMYTAIRAIHSSILRAPAFQPADSVRFEDVLGRTKSLPYEYFRHIEVFNSYLQTQFKGLPGEQKVLQRQYLILDGASNPISEEEWGNTVFPGASLVMSALVEQLATQTRVDQCPRIGCDGLGVSKDRPAFKTCMEFAMERSAHWRPTKRKPDRPRYLRGATSQSSPSKQPRGNGSGPRQRGPDQGSLSEEDTEESKFWEKSLEPSEHAKRELRVFRRVHVQAQSPFLRTMHTLDKTHFWTFDILHVRETFPGAPGYLVERLGKAISRRRQYFSYRETYVQTPRNHDVSSQAGAETFEAVHKAPSHLSDVVTAVSYASLGRANDLNVLNVPRVPKAAHDFDYYECPICFHIIDIHEKHAWKKHVYRDLRPYLCTFENCDTADRMYQRRRSWFEHEMETHYSNTDTNSSALSCLLCGAQVRLLADLRKHLGRHQQQIAAFALPFADPDDDDDYHEPSGGSAGSSEQGKPLDFNDDEVASALGSLRSLNRPFALSDDEVAVEVERSSRLGFTL